MGKHGAEWYKREPSAYLGGVVGMPARLHAVYSVILDLIYVHGGECPNDPKWISGWFSDLGPAAVRNAISELVAFGKLVDLGQSLTNKRAQNEAKTREKLRENRRQTGKKGGISSGFSRGANNENNHLSEANGPPREEKIREEKKNPPKPPKGGDDEFEEWYQNYPRKVAKGAARRAFKTARKKADLSQIMAGVRSYAEKVKGKEKEFIAHPATWLNGERWLDTDAEVTPQEPPSVERRVAVARDWLSRNDSIPTWMDSRETAEALMEDGFAYEALRQAGFSLPPRGNVVDISGAVKALGKSLRG